MHNSAHRLYFWMTLSLLLFVGANAYAQDSLRMKTGAIYSVKIIEITETQVKYRTYSNPDGPLYNVSKNTIATYKLEGGRWEYFYEEPQAKRAAATVTRSSDGSSVDNNRRHYIGLNVVDLLRTDLTIFYEVMVAQNKIGLRVPFTYGFNSGHFNPSNPLAFRRNTVFKTGLDFRLYVGRGLRRVRFVLGPSLYYVRMNRVIPDLVTYDKEFMLYKTGNSIRTMFFTGLIIRPNDYLQLGIDGGMGTDIDINEEAKLAYLNGLASKFKLQINIHLGYRF